MEYLTVQFDATDPRDVIANGNPIGSTDKELMLQADYYQITLSGNGYQPPVWEGPISGTQPANPFVIVFTRA